MKILAFIIEPRRHPPNPRALDCELARELHRTQKYATRFAAKGDLRSVEGAGVSQVALHSSEQTDSVGRRVAVLSTVSGPCLT